MSFKLEIICNFTYKIMTDLPTRKLNLIQYLAQSQDVVFLEKLEQLT